MGDRAAQQQTNGTPSNAAPELLPGPGRVAQAQARIRTGRMSTLAALEQGTMDDPPPAEVKPPAEKPAIKAPVKPPVEVEEPPADDAGDGDDAAELDDPDAADPAPETPPADAESAKRLASIQAAEKRSRDKITSERAAARAEAEKRELELKPRLAALDKFEAARKNIHRDPAAVLAEFGISDDAGLEAFARKAFSMTEAGKKDPAHAKAHAAQADRILKDREQQTELQALQKRLADFESKQEQKEQAAAFETKRSAFLDLAVKEIGEDAPISRALAAKNPAKLRDALWATTMRLIEQNDGEVPDIADIVVSYERTRRAELEELGVDPTSLATTTKKQNSQAAEKKNSAKTLGNDLSTPRVPRPTKSDREHRAETLKMLESGKLE